MAVVLPRSLDGEDPYLAAARRLDEWSATGLFAVDARPALYVYEMRTADGGVTRGLFGAVELRDPADGVILPHENTMAGPVADRLALMRATEANLEPIYLVYDGGGAAVRRRPRRRAGHRARRGGNPGRHVAPALVGHRPRCTPPGRRGPADRRALIADGHHRYATYRELQHELRTVRGAGPWDRGLTLLVDSSSYGPQVHAIHRVLHGLAFGAARSRAEQVADVTPVADPRVALASLADVSGFAAVLTDGQTSAVVTQPDADLVARSRDADAPAALADLDVTVLHRVLVEQVWGLPDREDAVGYAHSVDEAIAEARKAGGTAVLLRATPVAAVAAVAAAGARMPRKSTLFTPKPASGLVMRRFRDDA